MQNIQILQLEATQLINQLPLEELQEAVDYLLSLFHRKESIETKEEPKPQLSENLLQLQQMLWDEVGREPIPRNEPFIGDVTWDEYVKLSDEEQGKLWDAVSDFDPIEDVEEIEVPAHVLPVR